MAGKTRVRFDRKALIRNMFKRLEKEQTKRFLAYAKEKIAEIGREFQAWDDTGNLLNSLCWVVFYNGRRKGFGFYDAPSATEDSYLHELSKPPLKQAVDGKNLARHFVSSYRPSIDVGWEVAFAVTAPYWGYWEEGHENILLGQHVQFAIMAEQYDAMSKELSPAKVSFEKYVPKY